MNILIVQSAFLGDIVLSTALISGIKELYPDSKLYFLTTPLGREILMGDPLIEEVIAFDKRGENKGITGLLSFAKKLKGYQFDIAYCVHKSYRTALLMKLSGIPKRIGFKDSKLNFLYTDLVSRDKSQHEVLRAFSILSKTKDYEKLNPQLRLYSANTGTPSEDTLSQFDTGSPYVIIAPGSVWATKIWPAKYYRQVGEHLRSIGYQVILTGSNDEIEIANEATPPGGVNLAGKTSLNECLCLLRGAKALICNDSMILHAASALKVPTVTVFCSTTPEFGFGPWENRAIVIEKTDLECKPCSPHGLRSCPTGTRACMEQVPATRVIKAFEELMTETNERV